MANKPTIYMDYAAATPLDPAVLAAMLPYLTDSFYNPSATYLAATQVHKDLEAARAKVALQLGAHKPEITFTAGGTEANNLAIHGVMRRYPKANIVTSAIEHESVLVPARHYRHREAPVKPDGTVDLAALEQLVDEHTVLVSVMYANNEVGSIQPLSEVARVLDKIRYKRRKAGSTLPLYFHTDACQAAGYLDLHAARLGVDLLSLNGGKVYGPKQSGVLYVRGGIQLTPLVDGGGQEHGLRSGTENVAACVGLAVALELAQERRKKEAARLQALQKKFFGLLQKQLPSAAINGSRKRRLPNNVHITLPGEDNERLLFALDEAGIVAAAGSACSASNEEPSHVLKAMGVSDNDARASLRFTMGNGTSAADVELAVETLKRLIV